jgi:hypothetical protein
VVFCAAGDERFESILAGYTANERPQIRLRFCRNQIAAIFCGEDTMD